MPHEPKTSRQQITPEDYFFQHRPERDRQHDLVPPTLYPERLMRKARHDDDAATRREAHSQAAHGTPSIYPIPSDEVEPEAIQFARG